MTARPRSWLWLLALFTGATLIETLSFSHPTAFMPLYLPHLGVDEADVPGWTGRIVAVSGAIGIPFLPLWGALADRYSRHPLIVRSFVVRLAVYLKALACNFKRMVHARLVEMENTAQRAVGTVPAVAAA